MGLRSSVAVAVVWVNDYSSDLTPSLRTSICLRCSPKKTKIPKKVRTISMSDVLGFHNFDPKCPSAVSGR